MPTNICPFAPSYVKSLQEHILVGIFFICVLADCRMDSSLVRRYLCAIYLVIGDIKLRSIDICLNKYNIILIIV